MRARKKLADNKAVSFLCGNFLEQDFGSSQFDCVISAATLHHMQQDVAIARMVGLLRPGGRLVINDIRSDRLLDHARTYFVLGQEGFCSPAAHRTITNPSRCATRTRHCATEKYLTLAEVKEMASRLLPARESITTGSGGTLSFGTGVEAKKKSRRVLNAVFCDVFGFAKKSRLIDTGLQPGV